MKKLFVLFLGLLMFSLVSAITILDPSEKKIWDWDNTKKITEVGGQDYPDITIENTFGLGGDVWKGRLDSNTETCGASCSAEKTITISKPTELVSDVRFRRLIDEEWQDSTIRSYQFYINESTYEVTVDDKEKQCSTETLGNGTKAKTCEIVITGNHTERRTVWVEYNMRDVVSSGTYLIRLVGEKKPSWTYDWQIKTNGEWLDEWATWGSGLTTEETHGIPFLDSSGLANGWGMGFEVLAQDVTLINVTKNSSATTTDVNLTWGNETPISTQSFVGDVATFNIILLAGETYWLMSAGGASTLIGDASYGAGYPVGGTFINWTTGLDNAAANSGKAWLITSMNVGTGQGLVTLNFPDDNAETITTEVLFNATASLTGGSTIVNMSLYTNETGSWEIQNTTTGLSGTTEIQTWNRTFPDGEFIFLWGVQACDSDGDCGFSLVNRTLVTDTLDPETAIIAPVGQLTTNAIGDSENLNWTVSDTNLDSCWFDYNTTNITVQLSR